MRITWIGHACLLIETNSARCLTDPWLVDPIFGGSIRHLPPRRHRIADLPPIDLICITHGHFDHFAVDTLTLMDKKIPIVIPRSPVRDLKGELRSLGFANIIVLGDWHSHRFRDLTVSAIPSVNVPEEIAYVISSEGTSVFDAADCNFEPVSEEIGRRFSPDIGFIPFCGWDYSGLLGFDPERRWEPNYRELARSCQRMGLRFVAPAAANACWAPPELQWLNRRVCPGDQKNFFGILEEVSGGSIRPVALEPGGRWSCDKEEAAGPDPSLPVSGPESDATPEGWETWLRDPRFRLLTPSEVTTGLRTFLRKRRRHLLAVFPKAPKMARYLLTTALQIGSIDKSGSHFWNVDMRRWNPVTYGKNRPGTQLGLTLRWEDLCALVLGLADAQDLVMSYRFRMHYLRDNKDFDRIYSLEYLFFTRSLSWRASMNL